MAYTEITCKGNKKYYYRAKSVREGEKVMKERMYLGVNLSAKERAEREKKADKKLNILSGLLLETEIRELEKIHQEYLALPRENRDNRYEAFCSLFTHESTAIEGNTLTLFETASVLFEKRTPASKSLREVNEVLNHKDAFDYILTTKEDISKKMILGLHHLVVKNTLKPWLENQIGTYRTLQVYIRGADWLPPKPHAVPREMKQLLFWYSRNKKSVHPLIVAAYVHVAFESIHPFVDGNGRVGRLLMNHILHRHSYPMINIPHAKKQRYFNCLKEAQVKRTNLRSFIAFMLELLREEKVRF